MKLFKLTYNTSWNDDYEEEVVLVVAKDEDDASDKSDVIGQLCSIEELNEIDGYEIILKKIEEE